MDDYAGAGPIESWGIPMAIRVVIAEIEWKESGEGQGDAPLSYRHPWSRSKRGGGAADD